MVKKIIHFDNTESTIHTYKNEICHRSSHTTNIYYEINGITTFVLVKSVLTYNKANDIYRVTSHYFYNYKSGRYTDVKKDTITDDYRTN